MSAVNSCEECRIMTLNQQNKVWDCSKVNSQKVHVRKHHIQSMSIDLHSSNNKRVVSGYRALCEPLSSPECRLHVHTLGTGWALGEDIINGPGDVPVTRDQGLLTVVDVPQVQTQQLFEFQVLDGH